MNDTWEADRVRFFPRRGRYTSKKPVAAFIFPALSRAVTSQTCVFSAAVAAEKKTNLKLSKS